MTAATLTLLLTLGWPFVAGLYVGASSGWRPVKGPLFVSAVRGGVPTLFALPGLILAVLTELSMVGGAHDDSLIGAWFLHTDASSFGRILLCLGLVADVAAQGGGEVQRPALLRSLPFWLTGLGDLSLSLAEPVLRLGLLLFAALLVTLALEQGRGRAREGWRVLQRLAGGCLLALAGALHPAPTFRAAFVTLGLALVIPLFPMGTVAGRQELSAIGRISPLVSAISLMILDVSLRGESGHGGMILLVLGFLTVAYGAVRMRYALGDGPRVVRQNMNAAVVCSGLAALGAATDEPFVTCIALLAPVCALPFVLAPEEAEGQPIPVWPGIVAVLSVVFGSLLLLKPLGDLQGALPVALVLCLVLCLGRNAVDLIGVSPARRGSAS